MDPTQKQLQALHDLKRELDKLLNPLDNHVWLRTDIQGVPNIAHSLTRCATLLTFEAGWSKGEKK